jgi:uncharacterized protein (TIGR03083 family)
MAESRVETKLAVVSAIDDTWRELRRALAGLTSRDMDAPGVCGDWSVKDLLGHITTWENEVLKSLAAGKPLPVQDVDAYNEAEVAAGRRVAARDVLVVLEDTHRLLRETLGSAPAAAFEHGSPLRKLIDEDTVEHYREHTQHIREFARALRQTAPEKQPGRSGQG